MSPRTSVNSRRGGQAWSDSKVLAAGHQLTKKHSTFDGFIVVPYNELVLRPGTIDKRGKTDAICEWLFPGKG